MNLEVGLGFQLWKKRAYIAIYLHLLAKSKLHNLCGQYKTLSCLGMQMGWILDETIMDLNWIQSLELYQDLALN